MILSLHLFLLGSFHIVVFLHFSLLDGSIFLCWVVASIFLLSTMRIIRGQQKHCIITQKTKVAEGYPLQGHFCAPEIKEKTELDGDDRNRQWRDGLGRTPNTLCPSSR